MPLKLATVLTQRPVVLPQHPIVQEHQLRLLQTPMTERWIQKLGQLVREMILQLNQVMMLTKTTLCITTTKCLAKLHNYVILSGKLKQDT